METQGMPGGISTVILCTSTWRSCWQLKWWLCKHSAGTQLCWALQALWTSQFSPNTQRICSVHLCNSDWALDITTTKPRGYPSLMGRKIQSQQCAQAILVPFWTKILGDLFVIPNWNSTLRTYNDARQNRLAGSIHAYSLRWPGAHSHGTRLFSLCWTAKKNRFRRIICTVFKLLLFWRKLFSQQFFNTAHLFCLRPFDKLQFSKNVARSNRLT